MKKISLNRYKYRNEEVEKTIKIISESPPKNQKIEREINFSQLSNDYKIQRMALVMQVILDNLNFNGNSEPVFVLGNVALSSLTKLSSGVVQGVLLKLEKFNFIKRETLFIENASHRNIIIGNNRMEKLDYEEYNCYEIDQLLN